MMVTVPDMLDRVCGEHPVTVRAKKDRRMGSVLDLLAGVRRDAEQAPGVESPTARDGEIPEPKED